jgi:hypothetical protein
VADDTSAQSTTPESLPPSVTAVQGPEVEAPSTVELASTLMAERAVEPKLPAKVRTVRAPAAKAAVTQKAATSAKLPARAANAKAASAAKPTSPAVSKPVAPAAVKPAAAPKPAGRATRKATPAATPAKPSETPRATAKTPPKTPAAEQSPATNARPLPETIARSKKAKLVRDSFTMPEAEYDLLAAVKKRCIAKGVAVKKSEVLRAAVIGFAALGDAAVMAAVQSLEVIKTGRPPKKLK